MNRGLFGQNTKPMALAPASTAASASSSRVIPQIFTNIARAPAPRHHTWTRWTPCALSLSREIHGLELSVLRVLCGGVALEQPRQRESRILRGHQPLTDQERAIAERTQARDIVRALQPAFADRDDVL